MNSHKILMLVAGGLLLSACGVVLGIQIPDTIVLKLGLKMQFLPDRF